jgi:hypothetical protein
MQEQYQLIFHKGDNQVPMRILLCLVNFLKIFQMSAAVFLIAYLIAVCLSNACCHKKVSQQLNYQHVAYPIATSLLSSAPILYL